MYTLYYAPDNASLIVRIVLEELAVSYNTWLVDRATHEQESDTYRKLNPNGLIPVCIIDEQPVFETAAIVLMLADRHKKLAPVVDSIKRPQFLKWLFFISNTLHADLQLLFYPDKYFGRNTAGHTEHTRLTKDRLHQHFDLLEAHLDTCNAVYFFGREPTIVDIYAAVCMRWAQLYPRAQPGKFTPDDYPALKAMMCRLEIRPAFVRAFEAEGIPSPYLSAAQLSDGTKGAAL